MSNIGPTFITVFAGIIGLAIIAVLVGQKAQTSTVISSAGGALVGIINAAVQPVSAGTGLGGNSMNTVG